MLNWRKIAAAAVVLTRTHVSILKVCYPLEQSSVRLVFVRFAVNFFIRGLHKL